MRDSEKCKSEQYFQVTMLSAGYRSGGLRQKVIYP